jgi:hypothetical protein
MGGLGPSSRRVRSMPGLVRCGNCSELLAEPSDLPEAQRRPCPHCGAKHRTFEKNLAATVAVSADVVVAVSAASARAGTGYPTGSIARLEDAGFDLQWLRLPEGGAWMVRVFDRQGTLDRRLDPGRPAGGVAGGLRTAPTAAKTVRVTE